VQQHHVVLARVRHVAGQAAYFQLAVVPTSRTRIAFSRVLVLDVGLYG
jgi:hypothetical protein